jgi:hypothetical protein
MQSTPYHYEVIKLDGRKENYRSVLNRGSLQSTFSQRARKKLRRRRELHKVKERV